MAEISQRDKILETPRNYERLLEKAVKSVGPKISDAQLRQAITDMRGTLTRQGLSRESIGAEIISAPQGEAVLKAAAIFKQQLLS